MIRRIAIAAAATAAGLLATLPAAAPASAATSASGPSASCVGSSCSVGIERFISYDGNAVGSGAGYAPVDVQPPPCQWVPVGDATSGSKYVVNSSGGTDPGPSGLFDTGKSFTQAKGLLKDPQPGTWYYLPVNPDASAAGKAECLKLPLYVFVPPGGTPPMPPVPGRTLAEFAYNHMNIPAPALTINPAARGFVNLGSYVWQTGPAGARWVRAALGNQSATVTATPGKLQISTDGPGTIGTNCGRTGSASPVGRPPKNAGAGTLPDCGVLWRAPVSGATITATVLWHVAWTATDGTGGTLPPIRMQGQAGPIPVSEIQSVNGT